MQATAASSTSDRTTVEGPFGIGRLFLADSRLALIVLNQARYLALNRLLGLPREQANLVTVVVSLIAADAAYEGARRITRPQVPMPGAAAAIAACAVREGVFRVAGPSSRDVPLFGTLVAVAMIVGLVVPGLRRKVRGMREAEHRLRDERIRRYSGATGG